MAALKITNSINQHYSQQNLDALTPVYQSNMPFLAQSPAQSDTSSTNTSTVTNTANTKTAASTANTNTTATNNSMHTNPADSPDGHSAATDVTLSRQTSADATQSSLHDYTFDESMQTLSSSTSGTVHIRSTRMRRTMMIMARFKAVNDHASVLRQLHVLCASCVSHFHSIPPSIDPFFVSFISESYSK